MNNGHVDAVYGPGTIQTQQNITTNNITHNVYQTTAPNNAVNEEMLDMLRRMEGNINEVNEGVKKNVEQLDNQGEQLDNQGQVLNDHREMLDDLSNSRTYLVPATQDGTACKTCRNRIMEGDEDYRCKHHLNATDFVRFP